MSGAGDWPGREWSPEEMPREITRRCPRGHTEKVYGGYEGMPCRQCGEPLTAVPVRAYRVNFTVSLPVQS